MGKYFRITNPDTTCAGPKAGVGYIRCYVPNMTARVARGLTGKDASVHISGWGIWILNETEYEHITEKEYFVGALKDELKVFKNYI